MVLPCFTYIKKLEWSPATILSHHSWPPSSLQQGVGISDTNPGGPSWSLMTIEVQPVCLKILQSPQVGMVGRLVRAGSRSNCEEGDVEHSRTIWYHMNIYELESRTIWTSKRPRSKPYLQLVFLLVGSENSWLGPRTYLRDWWRQRWGTSCAETPFCCWLLGLDLGTAPVQVMCCKKVARNL